MGDRPLVTVVLPVYNHEGFVRETLQSVHDQDYEAIELVVVDDCSADGSVEAVRAWLSDSRAEERFARATLIVNERNRGAHHSLNRGAAEARGDVLSFLNSDDLYAPSRLGALVGALEDQDAELAFSAVRCRFEGEPLLGDLKLVDEFENEPAATIERSLSVSWAACQWNVAISTGNLVCRAGLVDRIGGFAALRYCHDWDFLLRACLETEPVFVPEPLYTYTMHGGNSFRDLGGVSGSETERVQRRYFTRADAQPPANPSCPSPWNQPTTFESLMRLGGMTDALERFFRPYRDVHRTVSFATARRHKPTTYRRI